jgi:hypothetical protein
MGGNPNYSSGSSDLSKNLNVAPLQFQAQKGWDIQSSRPELVSQGIASAISSIGQGALAGYSAKAGMASQRH